MSAVKVFVTNIRKTTTTLTRLFLAFIIAFSYIATSNISTLANTTFEGPETFQGNPGVSKTIPGVSVGGEGNPNISVRLAVTHGSLSFETTTGITFDDETTGPLLYISGLLSDINEALATLQYTGNSLDEDVLELTMTEPGEIFNPNNGHLYEFELREDIDWNDAHAEAQTLTKYGLSGYLATLSSDEENAFVAERLLADGWFGASDAGAEGDWKWVSGPENGTTFWNGDFEGGVVQGQYANWNPGEPNDAGNEDCGQFYADSESFGKWNDLPCNGVLLDGYVVEYGDDETEANIASLSIPITNVATTIHISNCEELQIVDDAAGSHLNDITLTDDIDCTNQPVSALFKDSAYEGTFDGQGHSISGYDAEFENGTAGLFSQTAGATIKDLRLLDGEIHAVGTRIGALVGSAADTIVEDVHSEWDVLSTTFMAGGLIGESLTTEGMSSIIRRSSTSGEVSGATVGIGGLIGYVYGDGGTIIVEKSFATGNISATGAPMGIDGVGGLIGYISHTGFSQNSSVTIQDVYAQGNISAAAYHQVGGLIGYIEGVGTGANIATTTIQRGYASGSVVSQAAGGLIGYLEEADGDEELVIIRDVFATSTIQTADSEVEGGLIGFSGVDASLVTFANNYFDQQGTTADSCIGSGGIQYLGCTAINSANTSSYFKNNFVNEPMHSWDFASVWRTNVSTYPTFGTMSDEDGVSGSIEDAAPNNGDANDDGVLDNLQTNVTSYVNTVSGNYTTLELPTGDCSITAVSTKSKTQLAIPDQNYDYPLGLIDFTANCGTPGYTATITQYYFGQSDTSTFVLRKYNASNNNYTAIENAVISAVVVGGTNALKVVYEVTDGSSLDDDGTANGSIVDPAGLGLLVETTATVPDTGLQRHSTLPAIGMILVGTLVLLSSMKISRKVLKK
jgi:Lectin C-type domain